MYPLFTPPSQTSIAVEVVPSKTALQYGWDTDALLNEIYGDDYMMEETFENLGSIETSSFFNDNNPPTITCSFPSSQPTHTSTSEKQNKSHGCDTCHWKFKTTYQLKTHLLIHTGETP